MEKLIVPGSASRILAKNLSLEIKATVATMEIERFPDGECRVRIDIPKETKEVIIIQSTHPDDKIVELFLLQDALREAERIVTIAPYYGYARQDKKFLDGEAVGARKMAELIQEGCDEFVTVDPHKKEIMNFFDIPASYCSAVPLIAEHIKEKDIDMVIAPDEGALGMAEEAAKIIGCGYDYFEKKRLSGKEVKMEMKKMSIHGNILIIDDIISTGGTMVKAIKNIKRQGAKKIFAACTHGLFVGKAIERMKKAGCDEILATDTVESNYSRISVAPAIAKVLGDK